MRENSSYRWQADYCSRRIVSIIGIGVRTRRHYNTNNNNNNMIIRKDNAKNWTREEARPGRHVCR